MSDFTLPQEIIILIPFLNIIGTFLKNQPTFPNWLIPQSLGLAGIIFGILIQISKTGFSMTAIIHGIINGIIAAGVAVYGYEVIKQSIKKDAE